MLYLYQIKSFLIFILLFCVPGQDICQWALGHVAVVTGAGQRVGKAIAASLHKRGYTVAIHYNESKDEAISFMAELNSIRKNSAYAFHADLSRNVRERAGHLLAEVVEKWGRLDLLVNSAAIYYATPIAETTEEQWDKLLDLNAKAPYFMTQAAAPYLKETHGSVVNVADILGERPNAPFNVYCITKATLIMITKSLALELAPENWISKTPLGRARNGEEVGDTVAFLASPSAAFMTGAGISPSGGRTVAL
ncbi:Pteridine reductase 1 [Portunus trituberculatus]|uniref:Pteridine reductase 1 n=1 Tax=Portunus trituberculatus TaxID=210409 RepID=A0A5B7DE43_PORTR|nr:Pteridine reductase 1 [Portunus trituberculatus]